MRLTALLLMTLISSCRTGDLKRRDVQAAVWLETGLPSDLCEQVTPECKLSPFNCTQADFIGWRRGKYRKLDTGKEEFLAYCNIKNGEWTSIRTEYFKAVLDALLPEKK